MEHNSLQRQVSKNGNRKGKTLTLFGIMRSKCLQIGENVLFLGGSIVQCQKCKHTNSTKDSLPLPLSTNANGLKVPLSNKHNLVPRYCTHQSMIYLKILVHTDTSVLFNRSLKKPNPDPVSINYPF